MIIIIKIIMIYPSTIKKNEPTSTRNETEVKQIHKFTKKVNE